MSSRPKILVSDKADAEAIEALKAFSDLTYDATISPEALLSTIGQYDALLVRSRTQVTAPVIEASNLKAIGRMGVGLDNIDMNAAKTKGIAVFNAGDAPAIAVAELALGMALSLCRSLHKANEEMRRMVWNKTAYLGSELYGKTAGVVGCGNIGQEFAKRAAAFGMNVIGFDPFASAEVMADKGIQKVELDDLFAKADLISLHLPKTPETTNLVNGDRLARMKPTALLINTARGGIVDEAALAEALEAGRIAGAGLDVFEVEPTTNERLAKLSPEKIVLAPHIGGSTAEAQRRIGLLTVDKVRRFLLG